VDFYPITPYFTLTLAANLFICLEKNYGLQGFALRHLPLLQSLSNRAGLAQAQKHSNDKQA
jgi:hypothetical protein